MSRKPRAFVVDAEASLPIEMNGVRYSFATAKQLSEDLAQAVRQVSDYFQCAHDMFAPQKGIRCFARGSVKIGAHYYCKMHAKKFSASGRRHE